MNEWIRRMLNSFRQNFGRPQFDLGNDDKIDEADATLRISERKRKELELRAKLLEIKATPRGMPHD